MAIPANGVLDDTNLLITYTDKDTNEVLDLKKSVVVSTVTGATTKGDYKVTIAPKPKQYNVIGDAKTATATLVAAVFIGKRDCINCRRDRNFTNTSVKP